MTRRLLIIEKENPADLATYTAALAGALPTLKVVTAASEDEALAVCEECDGVAAKAQYIPAAVIARMPRLRWVQALTTGIDPLAALGLPADVAISSVRGVHGPQMAELTFLMMLSLARDFPRTLRNQSERLWQRWPQRMLDGRTILIVGIGVIGEAIAARANAFGMRVIGVSDGRSEAPGFTTIAPYAELAAQAAAADFVVVVTPYSARSHNLIDATVLRSMLSHAFLVNVSRGRVVDEAALLAVLNEGGIAGAALDVFEHEPLPSDSPLWQAPNLIVTPHVGGMSDRYAEQVLPILIQNARAFIDGRLGDLTNPVTL